MPNDTLKISLCRACPLEAGCNAQQSFRGRQAVHKVAVSKSTATQVGRAVTRMVCWGMLPSKMRSGARWMSCLCKLQQPGQLCLQDAHVSNACCHLTACVTVD